MKFFCTFSLIVLLSSFTIGQRPTRSQELSRSVAELYQNGKYDEAIPIAEEIVELERKAATVRNLVSALENLAELKIARFKRLIAEFNAGTIEPNAIKDSLAKLNGGAESAEKNLREAIELADRDAIGPAEQRAAIRSNLAWLLYHFQPNDPELVIAFDKTGRDKFEMRSRARYQKRIGEAANLYRQASKIAQEADPKSNTALLTTYKFAEFALANGDLEDAIQLLETSIADVERIYGPKSASIVQPLELYIKALTATGQDDLAFDALSRLVRVTSKSAEISKDLVNISYRADKVFAPVNSSSVEASATANKETATLSGRSATFNSSFEAMLAVSTHGRQLYNGAFPANINKIPVRVLVDETGKVVEAEAAIADKDLKRDAEKAVMDWKFKPFTSAGKPRRMKGYVVCTFFTDRLMKRL